VPTNNPRYTFTDTGHLRQLLDAAQARWPDIADRKELLLRLAQEGHDALEVESRQVAGEQRRERAQAAVGRIGSLVDRDVLLSDRAWNRGFADPAA
jgi:hypothetical protein